MSPDNIQQSLPDDFISGSIIACLRVTKEAETNCQYILGCFNRHELSIPPTMSLPALPYPPAWTYLRFLVGRPRRFSWNLNQRVVIWNGSPLVGQAVPLAKGDVEVKEEHRGMAEFGIPTIGAGVALTPERRSLISTNGAFTVQTRYELWADGQFLVAHSIDIRYTQMEDSNPNDNPGLQSDKAAQ